MSGSEQLAFGRRRRGRHEAAFEKAITAARAAGGMTERQAAVVTLLRFVARAMDDAEHESPFTRATVARETLAILREAQLLAPPDAADPFTELVASLHGDDH